MLKLSIHYGFHELFLKYANEIKKEGNLLILRMKIIGKK
jgi:hypothetical protein